MINQKQAQNIALQALVYISELPEEGKNFYKTPVLMDRIFIHWLKMIIFWLVSYAFCVKMMPCC